MIIQISNQNRFRTKRFSERAACGPPWARITISTLEVEGVVGEITEAKTEEATEGARTMVEEIISRGAETISRAAENIEERG